MDILDTAGQEQYSAIVLVNTLSAEFIGIFIDKLQISFTITIIMKKQTKFTYECVNEEKKIYSSDITIKQIEVFEMNTATLVSSCVLA